MDKKIEIKIYEGGEQNSKYLCDKYKKYLGEKTSKQGFVCRYYTCYGTGQGQFDIEYKNSNITSWVNAEDIKNYLTQSCY